MPHPHGTINRYNNQRCRCDACRAAIRDYRRAQRARAAGIEQARPLNRSSGNRRSGRRVLFPRVIIGPAIGPDPIAALLNTGASSGTAGRSSRSAVEGSRPPTKPGRPLRRQLPPLTWEQLLHLTVGSQVVWGCGHADDWATVTQTAPPCRRCGEPGAMVVVGSTAPVPYPDIPVVAPWA
jgi:hypothetical protein